MKRLFTVLGLVLAMSAVAPVAFAAGGCGNSVGRNQGTQATGGGVKANDAPSGSASQASGLNRGK